MAAGDRRTPSCFVPFTEQPIRSEVPDRFTFPFHYRPHSLCQKAAAELQSYLSAGGTKLTTFGPPVDNSPASPGKMFGVLVVEAPDGTIGYLRAFSGKLGDAYLVPGFVPPVYNPDAVDGFFRAEEAEITALNHRLAALENAPDYLAAREKAEEIQREQADKRVELSAELRENKRRRDLQRKLATDLSPTEEAVRLTELAEESKRDHFREKDKKKAWKLVQERVAHRLAPFEREILAVKRERKDRSAALQERLFTQYTFLNPLGEEKSLGEIFRDTALRVPPAGAGECALPRLLQYAFREGLRPLAMAEFWWGRPPATVVRHHGRFYPACRGKCEPILGHMLTGIPLESDPFRQNPAAGKTLDYLYEDDFLAVINKPAEFLSVPGRHIEDSVWLRVKARYPEATGPLIVHRLDMSTSGLMVVAKTVDAYHHLQRQFAERQVKKCYVALLNGTPEGDGGTIDLPLRPDYIERPRQQVCSRKGKPALTRWTLIKQEEKYASVYFYPETGRTHQLRVHAAHVDGLGTPILGDDLYGEPADRLYLHAESIAFEHPESGKLVRFSQPAPF